MARKIKNLKIGENAVISGFEKTEERYREKVLSMGLTKGTQITLKKYAPLGDPVEISVRDYNLSLRKEEADTILLEGGENHE
jgi:ferrous iron transport protein A